MGEKKMKTEKTFVFNDFSLLFSVFVCEVNFHLSNICIFQTEIVKLNFDLIITWRMCNTNEYKDAQILKNAKSKKKKTKNNSIEKESLISKKCVIWTVRRH